jgi:hypothetical protein
MRYLPTAGLAWRSAGEYARTWQFGDNKKELPSVLPNVLEMARIGTVAFSGSMKILDEFFYIR